MTTAIFIEGVEGEGMVTADAEGRIYNKTVPAGSCEWRRGSDGQISTLLFTCPCGCGAIGGLPVRAGAGGWKWDGNETQPTTTPSIKMVSPCVWHGYLTKGVFVPC